MREVQQGQDLRLLSKNQVPDKRLSDANLALIQVDPFSRNRNSALPIQFEIHVSSYAGVKVS
jgi:hypothetical protein